MSKLFNESVTVSTSAVNGLSAFIWRKRLYHVTETLGRWKEPSEWWRGEPVHSFVRVNAKNKAVGTYELFQSGNDWFLHRIID